MFKLYPYLQSTLLVVLLGTSFSAGAQQFQDVIQTYLRQEKVQWKLTDNDIANYTVSDQYDNMQTGITYTYLHQQVAGIRIFGAVSTMAIRDGKVMHYANRFHPDAAQMVDATQPALSAEQAIEAAAKHVDLTLSEMPALLATETNRLQYTFSRAGIAQEDIKVELVLVPVDQSLRLAWNVNIAPLKSADWWNIRVDALSGQFIEKNNWTSYCDFGTTGHHGASCNGSNHQSMANAGAGTSLSGSYNVYPLPLEAPTFGGRSILTSPHSPEASPYGWHDTDGADGAEHTITRGNNVHAYEDLMNLNEPGYSPDGGPGLNFDFPLDLQLTPTANQDAVLTNLFYMNNVLHDVLLLHGFDEAAGNFQETNYTGVGLGADYVRAEGLDGGGTNNANFSTPDDGNRGRMQMYLWPVDDKMRIKVSSSQGTAGNYLGIKAIFGPDLTAPITANAVLAIDGVSPTNDGCEPIQNASEVAGKIAIVDRGYCSGVVKAEEAEAAGAIAVIVVNNVPGLPVELIGLGAPGIPSFMISQEDGELIKAQLLAGETLEITLEGSPALDGSLDNGIIAHELGHGLSNRLTGGPSNSSCLNNEEQGGEGWSDWLALITTIEPGDAGANARGIGTYAIDDNSGVGIRRYPYSTDMSINPLTYGAIDTSGGVHARGEVWCSALWEMTWLLIETEGFDPDWYNGTSGNNTAMRLVIEGMKLQPCRPGYLDARDAILAADELLYQGAHRCLIWEAFAKRGMGALAIQGASTSSNDQVQDFSTPVTCQFDTEAPTASFVAEVTSKCLGSFGFTDQSTNLIYYHNWDFGDGTTSDVATPEHTYANPGVYTVTLIVTNNIGSDTVSQTVSYEVVQAPTFEGNTVVCEGGSTQLKATVLPGYEAAWLSGDSIIHVGNSFLTPAVTAPTTYTLEQLEIYQVQNVGPANNTIGTGGNHNAPSFEGRLLFKTLAPVKLISVLVYAQTAGNRTIRLLNQSGQVIQSKTVFVPVGANRVTLNFDIPVEGNYSLAGNAQNLYRNTAGATYPYKIDDLISIYSSSASDALNYYFYFYDWEVKENSCPSEATEVNIVTAPGPLAAFTTVVNNLTATFTNTTSGSSNSRIWDFGDGSPVSFVENPVHTYTQSGTYEVNLTVSNGTCISTYLQTLTIGINTSANDVDDPLGIKVYPNPATDEVNIEFLQAYSGPLELKVTSADGRVVMSRSVAENTTRVSINTSSLAAGAYQLLLIGDAGVSVRTVAIVR